MYNYILEAIKRKRRPIDKEAAKPNGTHKKY